MSTIYIVTGAAGFLGSNVVRALEARGETVVALVRSANKAEQSLKGCDACIIQGDVTNKEDINKLFETAVSIKSGARVCFIHAASVVYLGKDKKLLGQMYDVNINGTQNVVEACLEYKCRLIYISSVHAIPEAPKRGKIIEINNFDEKKVIGGYARTKARASGLVLEAFKNKGLDAIIIHPSGIAGPGDFSGTHVTQLVQDFCQGRIPASTNGGYDFVDVRDVADGIICACKEGKSGECYLLTNRYYSVKELLDTLHKLGAGKKLRLKIPRSIAILSLPFMGLYYKIARTRPLYTRYSLYTLGSNSNFCHEKATRELGYNPRDIEESLRDTLEFLK